MKLSKLKYRPYPVPGWYDTATWRGWLVAALVWIVAWWIAAGSV